MAPLAGVAGTATFEDSTARARDILWIALAGPAASLLGTVLTAAALRATAAGGIAHHVFWSATLLGATVSVINLLPLRSDDLSPGGARTDGRLAMDALRVMRMAPPRRGHLAARGRSRRAARAPACSRSTSRA